MSGQSAAAEVVRLAPPQNASEARGTTFLGTVERLYTGEVQGHTLHFLVWQVARVYSGASQGIAGEDPRPGDGRRNEVVEPDVDVAVYQPGDGVNSLDVGGTYLFSTADIDTPVVGNSVAWAVSGDKLTWVDMSPVRGGGDRRFFDVHTLAQGVALMAPELPATDAAQVAADAPSPLHDRFGMKAAAVAVLLNGAVAVVATLVWFKRIGGHSP